MKPFPAIYSTLSPVALASLIANKYNAAGAQCSFLSRGVHDTYLVTAMNSRYILRVYNAAHRSLPQIQEELMLLEILKQNDVPVSYPLAALSGETIQTLAAVEGERHAVLFSYAPGKSIRQFSDIQLRTLGRQMARFHTVSATIAPGHNRWRFDTPTTLIRPLAALAPGFAENTTDYHWLQETASRAVQKLDQLPAGRFAKGYCHYDFLPKNFHFNNDAVTFFDFDFMGYGWLVNDIMTFWQHLMLEVYAGRMKEETATEAYTIFLDAYCAIHPLSAPELEAVPYLSLGFWLFYMHFHTTHEQFYAFTQPSQLKLYTGFLRYIVAKYWYAG